MLVGIRLCRVVPLIKRVLTNSHGLRIFLSFVVAYVPSVTGRILIEPYDIAEFLALYVLGDSYFLNKPIVILNFAFVYDSLRY
jgi:hypothetical protein